MSWIVKHLRGGFDNFLVGQCLVLKEIHKDSLFHKNPINGSLLEPKSHEKQWIPREVQSRHSNEGP